jgi:hypothetical protein
MTATTTPTPQTLTMQGIAVPASSVNPAEFFRRTRRLRFKNTTAAAIQGFGNTDSFTLRQTGIIAALSVKVFGTLTVALAGGTCASTARWPYDLIKRLRVSANGQSNLVNASGEKLRAREFMAVGDLTDRGVPQASAERRREPRPTRARSPWRASRGASDRTSPPSRRRRPTSSSTTWSRSRGTT